MKIFRSARLLLLTLMLGLVPASSYAGVFISVGFAPPMLPVYEQPLCPEEGWMWTPGYWAYGDDGYFWVPGAWVPAPYEGALWTPPYWGWSEGFYMFHSGYWGRHVGYYGGVNYGFGYMGIGFVGGRWHDHDFEYNRAVMRVDERFSRHTYEDREVVNRYTVARDSHIAYSGGPGGIRHDPGREERMADREQHTAVTSYQQQHESAARSDRSSFFRANGGHPQVAAVPRPLGMGNHTPPASIGQANQDRFGNRPQGRPDQGFQPAQGLQSRPGYQNNQNPAYGSSGTTNRPQGGPAYRPNPSPQPQQQQFNNRPQPQPQYQQRPQQYSAPAPRPQPQPQYRPAPQPQYRPAPQQQQSRPAPQPQHQEAPRGDHEHR